MLLSQYKNAIWAAWRLNSATYPLSLQQFVMANIKEYIKGPC